MEFRHTSVLLEETIENLLIRPDGVYVDGTLGGGGHSSEILKHLSSTGTLIGIDRDDAAISAAGERLHAAEDDRVHIVRGNYSEMPEIVRSLAFDITLVAEGNHYFLVRNQIQHVHITGIVHDFRPAVIAKLIRFFLQIFFNDI